MSAFRTFVTTRLFTLAMPSFRDATAGGTIPTNMAFVVPAHVMAMDAHDKFLLSRLPPAVAAAAGGLQMIRINK